MQQETESIWQNLVKATISIDDLLCGGGGALTIERRLASMDGVAQAYVNPHTEMAYVAFDPRQCAVEQIQSAIRDLGFRPGEPQFRPK